MNAFYRDEQGKFVSPTKTKVTELFPQMLGHGFEQTEEDVERVEKSGPDYLYARGISGKERAKRLGKNSLAAAPASVGTAGGIIGGLKVASKVGGRKGALAGAGVFAAGAGAGTYGQKKIGDKLYPGTTQGVFGRKVSKASPDMADVHIQGVLRPLPRAKKRRG